MGLIVAINLGFIISWFAERRELAGAKAGGIESTTPAGEISGAASSPGQPDVAAEPAPASESSSPKLLPVPVQSAAKHDEPQRRARIIAELLVKERFAEIVAGFDESLRSILSQEALAGGWREMKEQLGSFQQIITVTSVEERGHYVVDLKCRFEAGVRVLRVGFSPDKRIESLWLLPPNDHPTGEVRRMAREVVRLLVKGDYAGIAEKFDGAMRVKFPPEQIRQVWESATLPVGSFRQIAETRSQDGDVVDIRSRFDRGSVYVRVGFDERGKIRALWIQSAPR
jgi:hypothetical protein